MVYILEVVAGVHENSATGGVLPSVCQKFASHRRLLCLDFTQTLVKDRSDLRLH